MARDIDALLADDPGAPKGVDALLADESTPEPMERKEENDPWWKRAAGMGLKSSFTARGQLMQNLLPDSVMNVARTAAASVAGAVPGVSEELIQDLARSRTTDEFNKMVRDEDVGYQADRANTGRTGFDWWRTAGSLSDPTAWLMPSSKAATLVEGIKAGAKTGAFQALLQPVASEGNFIWDKGTQLAVGTVTGGSLGGALKLLEPYIQKGTNVVRNWLGPSASDKALDEAAERLAQNVTKTATDKAQVNPDVYSAIRQEIGEAMKAGVNPSADVITRRADAAALPVPVQLTRGQASRDPMQFAWEHRASGQQGVGEPLSELLAGQNKALIANLNQLGAGAAPTTFDASQQIIKHIESVDEALRGRINEAYAKVRDSAGRPARVSNQGFTDRAKQLLTDGRPELADLTSLADYLPDTIRKQYNDIATGKLPLTVDTIQFLDRAWGGVQRGAGDDTIKTAIGHLRTALNDAPIDDTLGQESMAAYKAARGMARQRFGLIEANPAYKAIVNSTKQAEPDKFFQAFVEGADVAKLKALKQLVGADNTAMLQNTMVSQLKRAAIGNASDEAGVFSQAGYNKIMQDPVRAPRIQELFADNLKTLDQLYRVGRVSENLIKIPAASRVNTSNTASAAANIVRDVARSETGQALSSMLPNWMVGAKRVFSDAGAKVEEARAVQSAVNPGVTTAPLPQPRQPGMGRLSDLLARGGAATVTAEAFRKSPKQREEERE